MHPISAADVALYNSSNTIIGSNALFCDTRAIPSNAIDIAQQAESISASSSRAAHGAHVRGFLKEKLKQRLSNKSSPTSSIPATSARVQKKRNSVAKSPPSAQGVFPDILMIRLQELEVEAVSPTRAPTNSPSPSRMSLKPQESLSELPDYLTNSAFISPQYGLFSPFDNLLAERTSISTLQTALYHQLQESPFSPNHMKTQEDAMISLIQ